MQDDTVNAAAVVLAAAARSNTGLLPHHQRVEDRASTATKTRWWLRLKAKLLCFRPRPHGHHPRRIADYASPEPAHISSSGASYYHTHHATRPSVAFVAPPSSPASSLVASESPSPVQQQQLLFRLDAMSSSPTASIFAVGPYAREPQQLVSPPAFSASGLTEPSTAPLTPPSESAACGCGPQPAGSSPEVPFARFLSPSFQGGYHYQLQPGSPIGGTIVSSPVSTSSSPPAWMHRHRRSEEGSPPSREFVFGMAAGEWATTFADGEDGGRGASISIGDDTAEDGNQKQWPFGSSFPN